MDVIAAFYKTGESNQNSTWNRPTRWILHVEGSTALPFFPIHFPVITRAPIGQNGKLELKTNNGLTKMATGSDDSEFAEFNSSKVRKEFKERQEKLKRKEISSRKFGRMMVFDIVGDLKTERPVKMS